MTRKGSGGGCSLHDMEKEKERDGGAGEVYLALPGPAMPDALPRVSASAAIMEAGGIEQEIWLREPTHQRQSGGRQGGMARRLE
jgi:hypothetical protein